jgi:hypothetical protein
MAVHDKFLELCAAATAGELTIAEKAKLDAHLVVCPDCRVAMSEYEIASQHAVSALGSEAAPKDAESDASWSVDEAENALFKRLETDKDYREAMVENSANQGQRFTYRPSQARWREVWMPLAAAVLLAVALGIAAYRTGERRGTEAAGTTSPPVKNAVGLLEEQASDAGYKHAQLVAQLAENSRVIVNLKAELSEQQRLVMSLTAGGERSAHSLGSRQQTALNTKDENTRRDDVVAAAQSKLRELQKTVDALTRQREEATSQASALEARVTELTERVRNREEVLDQKDAEFAKQQELLEHDRDIRELMGARDLYIAEVHDVAGTGQTSKTYGRVFYTKGKRLIFYAYDLDGQPGIRNASTFQAWGRRGPDKQQALSLGIFYEDNVGKKRWVLKSTDPKTLEDIDAVFVTVEPNGGSQHPSGKQLLFAYLRISPNHP